MKRIYLSGLVLFLVFLGTACKVSDDIDTGSQASPTEILIETRTATEIPMCTPPQCSAGESIFCPTECTRGCGSICATYTPSPKINEISPKGDENSVLSSVLSFPDPSGYIWKPVIQGLDKPLGLTHAGDNSGRLFIVEQPGKIRIAQNGNLIEMPFLDIKSKVEDGGNEQGLLGLAFHPHYQHNGWFFANYTGQGGDTFISRFSVSTDADIANPDSELVIMRIKQPFANHNGGHLVFGPDGYLYIGMGDGGSAGDPYGNAQNRESLLGKILRIDVDHGDPYAIPGDNPFAYSGGLPEIWAIGVRNPWRFAFDRGTGDLFIGDVGQNQWEEIDYLQSGGFEKSSQIINLGWNFWEAAHLYEGTPPEEVNMIAPIWEYPHSQGCSVTGGIVYRGGLSEWQGIYLYGDFCSGTIWGLIRQPEGGWLNALLFETGANITSFGEDEQGEIYLVDRNGSISILEESR